MTAPAFAVGMGRQLDFLVPLDQDVGPFQGVDALFALPEIHVVVRAVGQDEVVPVLLPVVLVVVEGEAGLLFHTQHAGQLEEAALVLVAAGLAHADQAAAVPDEAPDGGGDLRVLPPDAAGVGGVGIAHVDEHVDLVQKMGVLLHILKAEELHVEGGAAQRLDDAGVAVVLLLVQGVVDHVAAPGADLAPAVEHRHPLDAVGGGALDVVVQLPELVADALHIVDEVGELEGQLQVAAVADAVDGFAQDGPPGGDPVLLGLPHRVAPLVEGVGEEIGQKAPFCVLDALDVRDQPQGAAVAHAAHDGVHAGGGEHIPKGLGADPVDRKSVV